MIWPDRPRAGVLSALNRETIQTVRGVTFTLPRMQPPSLPLPVRTAALTPRDAITYKRRLVPSPVPPEVRGAGQVWSDWEEAMPRPIRHAGQSMPQPQFVKLQQSSMSGEAAPHLVLVPLMPEDRAFGYIPAIVVSPAGLSGVPRASLEEQFDSGLRNWAGGVDDWVLDAAGARTGSLALFTPTLEKRDYEMEFLARIDHQSVTWVFRAANLNDYHFASIAITEGGSYEFIRGTVIKGVRTSADPTPITLALNRKNAVTIRLLAKGTHFSVSLDAQPLESWTDSRLPTGGIGFMGAPDDRARIYWVRLSPLGSPGKESRR